MPQTIIMKMRNGREGSIMVDASNGTVIIAFRQPDGRSVDIALTKAHAALLIEALQREMLDARDHPASDAVVAIAAFLKDRDEALGLTDHLPEAERLDSARQIAALS